MPDTAATLIAGAAGEGYCGLSARQCAMALLAIYAGGLTMQQMVDGAAANGYSMLSDRQLDQAILYATQ